MVSLAETAFAQASVRFNLRSNVRGATVALDGRMIGKTPFRGRVTAGTHMVKVSARGYRTEERRIVFRSTVNLTINLRRRAPRVRQYNLRINTNVRGARVYIDGKSMGRAPVRERLRAGRHRIKVTARGYRDYEETVNLNRNRTVRANLKRRRPPLRVFSLRVTANVRGARVYIDGKSMGRAPVREQLRAGRHRIKVTAPGYRDYEETVNLNRNHTVRANLKRRRPPPPRRRNR
jgi:hypothetical protein